MESEESKRKGMEKEEEEFGLNIFVWVGLKIRVLKERWIERIGKEKEQEKGKGKLGVKILKYP